MQVPRTKVSLTVQHRKENEKWHKYRMRITEEDRKGIYAKISCHIISEGDDPILGHFEICRVRLFSRTCVSLKFYKNGTKPPTFILM